MEGKAELKEFLDMLFAALMYFQNDEEVYAKYCFECERDEWGLIKTMTFSACLDKEKKEEYWK